MNAISLLIFDFGGMRFGLDATRVRECVWLPKLTPIEEVPVYIVQCVYSLAEIVTRFLKF